MSILKNSNRKNIQTLSFEKSSIFESKILKNMSVKNIHILPKNKLSLSHIKYMETSRLSSQSHESCLREEHNYEKSHINDIYYH